MVGPISQAAYATIVSRPVPTALGAGLVAALLQAMVSAVVEPIGNRVLVLRVKVIQAIKESQPSAMLRFFKTTLVTNLLQLPLFEAVLALASAFPVPATLQGTFTGFVFATVTLPIMNIRYRKSMQLPVHLSNIYEAYIPTVGRDMLYGAVRRYATAYLVGLGGASVCATSPEVLLLAVVAARVASTPFNEWRGYLLQTKQSRLTIQEFFKLSNFARSTIVGILQGLTLAMGYAVGRAFF